MINLGQSEVDDQPDGKSQKQAADDQLVPTEDQVEILFDNVELLRFAVHCFLWVFCETGGARVMPHRSFSWRFCLGAVMGMAAR